jgi:hypothetical protein
MIKYKVQRDVQGSAFMMDDIQKDIGLMKVIDENGIELKFDKGGLYMDVQNDAPLEDIMEEFMTRDFTLAWKGNT